MINPPSVTLGSLFYFGSNNGFISWHTSETMKWLCCILYQLSSYDSSWTVTMNVAHRALQNNWIYLIFFSVVSQLKVIANGGVYESFCISCQLVQFTFQFVYFIFYFNFFNVSYL